MDGIDRLIKKMGHDALIAEILKRKKYGSFLNVKRPGAPRDSLGDLWGLRDAFNHFQSLHPTENKESIADRLLSFYRNYRNMLKNPELYNTELQAQKELFQKVAWLKKISSKTVVNKIADLNRLMEKISGNAMDELIIASSEYDDIDVESLVDDPRDYQ